jgi:hypothetical protein
MTVGIGITNNLEAIAITDSRASGYGRQSDSANKSAIFSNSECHGVIFGSGVGNIIEMVLRKVSTNDQEKLDELSKRINELQREEIQSYHRSVLSYKSQDIKRKSEEITDEQTRKELRTQKELELLREYDERKGMYSADFILMAYDKVSKRIRTITITEDVRDEYFSSHIEMGSGRDGADLYMRTKLQGIEPVSLKTEQLLFYALNAFSTSTINSGVGGTPKIVRINENGSSVIEIPKTIALANLSGAYLSELNPKKLTKKRVISNIKKILNNTTPDYTGVSSDIGIDHKTLQNTYIPYSSWQERANRE